MTDDGLEGARRLQARDSRGLGAWLLGRLEAEFGRAATRDEANYCFVSAMMANLGELTKDVAAAREAAHQAEVNQRIANADPLHWRKRYDYDGCCYTMDAARLVDRSPTNPMLQRRGRVLATKGEWLTVEWRNTRNQPLVHALRMGWAGEPHRRDEHWTALSVHGHFASIESDIPPQGAGSSGDCWRFDPTTGLVSVIGSREPARRYRPTATLDLRQVLA